MILVIATKNAHKVAEIRDVLGPSFAVQSLTDYPDAPTVHEDASTFAGNATRKSVQYALWLASQANFQARARSSPFVLADDSGLEVDALNGAPGVNSARFASDDPVHTGNSPDADNNRKLLRLLAAVPAPERTAQFRCVLALTPLPSAEEVIQPLAAESRLLACTELFVGACPGSIAVQPTGARGFGYDPLFIPTGYTESFAELGEATKNRISHRAKALAKLKNRLESQAP